VFLTTAFIAAMALDVIGFAGSIVSARLIPLFLSQAIISANLVATSPKTVGLHVAANLGILGVDNRTQAAARVRPSKTTES
jgi:hypothetical protein